MANVYYAKEMTANTVSKLKQELKTTFAGCKTIAIKMHFGEPGNTTAFEPEDVKLYADILKELGFTIFLYDSEVNYGGVRANHVTHKEYAQKKGYDTIGEIRTSPDYVEVKGEHFVYQVCKELTNADGVLILSHFKGHPCCGFGGAIKNLGMGAMTSKSKTDIHNGGKPKYVGGCLQCSACVDSCPINGVTLTDNGPTFGQCWGCSDCHYACPQDCIKVNVAPFDVLLPEGASAAYSQFKKKYCINVLKNITKDCDCFDHTTAIIAKNAGVVMSSDIVACDAASRNIIIEQEHEDVFLKNNKNSGMLVLENAQRLLMGSMKYNLILL